LKKTVSIIIPFFNAEKTLSRCIESVVKQSYEQLEIVLINDGSTDRSEEICKSWKNKDQRIRIINKQNNGVSTARNYGIDYATGQFIQFVDADDYIDKQMTELLVEQMRHNEQYELVICGFQTNYYQKNSQFITPYVPHRSGPLTKLTLLQHIGRLYKETILQSPCNKLYRTNIIKNYGIYFNENLQLGEDLLFNLAYIDVIHSVYLLKKPLYNYTIEQENTLSTQFSSSYINEQRHLHHQLKNFLKKYHLYNDENKQLIKQTFTEHIIYGIAMICNPTNYLTAKERKEKIRTIINQPFVQRYLPYFNHSKQGKFVSYFIRKKHIQCLYYFFTTKYFLRRRMYHLFSLLKYYNKSFTEGLNR